MKYNKIPIIILFVAMVSLASCEEVIQLNLKNTAPVTVIDATINATSGKCVVQATLSAGFYDNNNLTRNQGAQVELIDGSGNVNLLNEDSAGAYSVSQLKVREGEILQLRLTAADGEVFVATTRAPGVVPLDSLKFVRGFGDPRPTSAPIYLINPKWQDPTGIANYYRFKVTKNGKSGQGSFNITSDEPFDGTEVDMPLYRYGFEIGDTVRFEFQCIDSVSHSYFSQVNDMSRPSFVSATPYNPVGNFDNGALGYFGIYFSEIRDTIVSVRK
jgi:hypothetical protein